MDAWIIWIIIAVSLIGIEILTQMVWTLCLAIGCIAGMMVYFCGFDTAWQITTAGITAIVAYFVLMPYLRKWQRHTEKITGSDARTGMDALLGRQATVTNEIRPGETGRVRIDGDSWQARAPQTATTINCGDVVVVDSYNSIILNVKPLNNL